MQVQEEMRLAEAEGVRQAAVAVQLLHSGAEAPGWAPTSPASASMPPSPGGAVLGTVEGESAAAAPHNGAEVSADSAGQDRTVVGGSTDALSRQLEQTWEEAGGVLDMETLQRQHRAGEISEEEFKSLRRAILGLPAEKSERGVGGSAGTEAPDS